MKPRATLLALFALAFLSLDAAAQARTGPSRRSQPNAAPVYGGYHRTKMLNSVRYRAETAQLGSASRRALLTTGRLPAAFMKPKSQSRHRR
jgi:hypothetical protein